MFNRKFPVVAERFGIGSRQIQVLNRLPKIIVGRERVLSNRESVGGARANQLFGHAISAAVRGKGGLRIVFDQLHAVEINRARSAQAAHVEIEIFARVCGQNKGFAIPENAAALLLKLSKIDWQLNFFPGGVVKIGFVPTFFQAAIALVLFTILRDPGLQFWPERGGISGKTLHRRDFLLRHRLEHRIAVESFAARPGFGLGAAVRRVKNPDRNAQFFAQVFGEIKRDRRPTFDRIVGSDVPFRGQIALWFEVANVRRTKIAQLRIIGIGQRVRVDFRVPAERVIHVRLPRSQPDFADQNIVHRERVFAFHRHRQRLADVERIEFDHPFSGGIGGRGFVLTVDGKP